MPDQALTDFNPNDTDEDDIVVPADQNIVNRQFESGPEIQPLDPDHPTVGGIGGVGGGGGAMGEQGSATDTNLPGGAGSGTGGAATQGGAVGGGIAGTPSPISGDTKSAP